MVLGTAYGCDFEAAGDLPPGAVQAFAASMPVGYRVLFDPGTVHRHAAIAHRRGVRAAHAELWTILHDPSTALCVVAEDRPGLLSAIAAVLVAHRIDVLTALVFCRTIAGGASEAIDLFWVRRADGTLHAEVDATEATAIGEHLAALLSGTLTIDPTAARPPELPPSSAPPAVVRFERDEGGRAVLIVDAPDRPGVLLTIARELFTQGTQIVRSLVRTADGRAWNRFELTEMSGGPLDPERRGQIVHAVSGALAWEGSAGRP